MPLTCSICHHDKWASEFSRRDRDLAVRVCKACREVRDRDERNRHEQALQEDKRICSVCQVAKPEGDFSNRRECRCKPCKATICRRAREALQAHVPTNHRGSLESGFVCSNCNVHKPTEEFTVRKGYMDYRCKQCMAAKATLFRQTDHGKFVAAKGIAGRRNLEWAISESAYALLRQLPCHYCGHALPDSGVGLDRKDCSAGYLESNVVPCCSECNLAKGSLFTFEEMLLIGKAIAEVKAARVLRGESFSRERGWGRHRKYQDQPPEAHR